LIGQSNLENCTFIGNPENDSAIYYWFFKSSSAMLQIQIRGVKLWHCEQSLIYSNSRFRHYFPHHPYDGGGIILNAERVEGMFWKYFAVIILTILGILAVDAQEATPTIEPLARDLGYRPPYAAFPSDLYCEDVNVAKGPTWGEITIGVSSSKSLEDYAGTIGYYDSMGRWADYISLFRIGSLRDESGPPSLIEACLDSHTQVVTALKVSINRPFYIQDLVAEFGVPDAVTWGSSNISRTVFWFDRGIAASVYILEESDILDYGEIGLIDFIPYQSAENFEQRWPYNRTNSENPLGGDHIYGPPPSEIQNPFNFGEVLTTITAEPSRTPTPTFEPRGTPTPNK